eukprot:2029605-Prymnesium_polylepis.1
MYSGDRHATRAGLRHLYLSACTSPAPPGVASMSSINQAMASGVKPLHIACLKGHTEVAAM